MPRDVRRLLAAPSSLFSALLALAGAAGCGGGGGGGGPPPPAANLAPVVSASSTSPIVQGTTLLLVGAANDPDGDSLTLTWTVDAKPPEAAVFLATPSADTTTVSGNLVPGTYRFRLAADDGSVVVAALATVVVTPAVTGDVYVGPREATVIGAVTCTAPRAGAAPFATPVTYTALEGGWSGLARVRDALGGYVSDEFYVIGDRGPNYGISARVPPAPPASTAFGAGAKVFPIAAYQQKITRLRLDRSTGDVVVVSTTGVRTRAGAPTVGLPSSAAGMTSSDLGWSDLDDATTTLAASADGFDFEGIVEDRFTIAGVDRRVLWTCDEYGPSIQMLEGDPASGSFGRILREYVPGVVANPGAGLFSLPATLRQRRDNRGFEGVAVTSRAVWAIVQSNLKPAFGDGASRLHRLVRLDKATNAVTVYAYDHVPDPAFHGTSHGAVKIGDMVAIGEREFLVLEHDGASYAHVYRVRVTDDTTPLLEAENGNYEKGLTAYVPAEKVLVTDLTNLMADQRTPLKPEGMVLVDPQTLALTYDNDFGFDTNETDVFPQSGDRQRNMIVLAHLPTPVLPTLQVVADYNPGVGTINCEIPAYDAVLHLGMTVCITDASVQVLDLADPTVPSFYRRDPIAAGMPTSMVAHAARGYYLVAVQQGGPGGNDALLVVRTVDGTLLRTLDLGARRGADMVTVSPNGRFAVVCNEAEEPWVPGSISVIDLGVGPFADAAAAAAGIVGIDEIVLSGLVPATGAFSTRWYDRIYNTIPPGVTATVGGFPIVLIDVNTRAKANGVDVPDQADVTFTFGATVVVGKYRLDAGGDGNTFLFQVDATGGLGLEPEYAAFTPDGSTCFVTLQEANAVVVLDFALPVPAIRASHGVIGLGTVNTPDEDVSNTAGSPPANFKDVLQKEREPDGVMSAVLRGTPCFLTLDEGDTFGTTPTESSGNRYRGGRTLSVFRGSDGALLGDTGNRFDFATNVAGRWGAFVEAGNRPRRGGCEPENGDIVHWQDRTLAVVGLERANAVALVDVTDPGAPSVIDVLGIGGLGANARLAPEGVKAFVVDGRVFVLVGFENSGTVGLFEVR